MSSDATPLPTTTPIYSLVFAGWGHGGEGVCFNPRTNPVMRAATALFASVKLVSCDLTLSGGGAIGYLVATVLYDRERAYRFTDSDVLNSPQFVVAGTTAVAPSATIRTGVTAADHYGTELKAVAIGEPTPIFVCFYGGVPTGELEAAWWQCQVRITFEAHGVAANPMAYFGGHTVLSSTTLDVRVGGDEGSKPQGHIVDRKWDLVTGKQENATLIAAVVPDDEDNKDVASSSTA